MEELGTYGKYNGMGWRHHTGLGYVLQCGGAGISSIWIRDVGADPPHGTGPGKFSAQGRQADYREAAKATLGWGMVVPTAGDSNVAGGI